MKSKFLKVMALICTLLLTLTFVVACNQEENPDAAGKVTIRFKYIANKSSQPAWQNLIKTYNQTQGVTDGVYVDAKMGTAYATASDFLDTSKKSYSVLCVEDYQDNMQSFAIKRDTQKAPNGYFVNLQSYADNDPDFQKNTINSSSMDWWRMQYNSSASQGSGVPKHIIGKGQDLIGVPIGCNTQVNVYSVIAFEAVGINIVSVAEEDLDSYNQQNGTNLKPHGYAEYKDAPVSGMKSSTNLDGKTVYKVFNNRISMNWEEQRNLLKYFTKTWNESSPTEYGYVSEYWFNYGWSVGGDVMGFNGTDYDFTLTDDSANYMVVDDNVKVNNTVYNKGDIVLYEDRVNAKNLDTLVAEGKLYPIASQYDAIKEYLSLNIATNKVVDTKDGTTYYGYQVANPETGSANNWITNGTIAMARTEYLKYADYASESYEWLDFCLSEQYREYVGGSTYQKGGKSGFENEYLKVIGETYDGEVYTGDIKQVNGVKILGAKTTAGRTAGLVIPACSDPAKYQAAWNFISWVATEGQQYIAQTKTLAPMAKDVLYTDKFANNQTVSNGRNLYAVAHNTQYVQRGDWGYFESGAWVTAWANDFNKQVRVGNMTISAFYNAHKESSETSLNNMYCIIKGIR